MKYPFEKLILVCTGPRCSEERPTSESGEEIRQELKDLNKKMGRKGTVRVCGVSCLDLCDYGPNIVIEPDGDVYAGLSRKAARRVYEGVMGDGPPTPSLLLNEAKFKK